MAIHNSSNRDTWMAAIAGAMLMVIFAVLIVNAGHNDQLSSASGPDNPTATHQGR